MHFRIRRLIFNLKANFLLHLNKMYSALQMYSRCHFQKLLPEQIPKSSSSKNPNEDFSFKKAPQTWGRGDFEQPDIIHLWEMTASQVGCLPAAKSTSRQTASQIKLAVLKLGKKLQASILIMQMQVASHAPSASVSFVSMWSHKILGLTWSFWNLL